MNFKDGRYVYWEDLELAMRSVLDEDGENLLLNLNGSSTPFGGRKVGGGLKVVQDMIAAAGGAAHKGSRALSAIGAAVDPDDLEIVARVWDRIIVGVCNKCTDLWRERDKRK